MKRKLVRLGSQLVPSFIGRGLAGPFTPIFMLHRIVDEQGEPITEALQAHRQQLQYLRDRNYQPLRLVDLLQRIREGKPLPRKSVVFTADDGFFDQAELIAPLFAEFDTPLTCFVITDFLDRKLWSWDDHLLYALGCTNRTVVDLPLPDASHFHFERDTVFKPQIRKLRQRLKSADQTHLYGWLDTLYQAAEVDRPEEIPDTYRPMSWDQAAAMIRMGHDIAPHTRTHRILSQLDDVTAEQEILGSWKRVREMLPDSVPVFAYPTGRDGDFTPRDEQVIANSDLLGAVTTIPGAVLPASNTLALPRYGMPENMTDFIQYLDWIEVVKDKLRRCRGR